VVPGAVAHSAALCRWRLDWWIGEMCEVSRHDRGGSTTRVFLAGAKEKPECRQAVGIRGRRRPGGCAPRRRFRRIGLGG
jgi:hypothetical protein